MLKRVLWLILLLAFGLAGCGPVETPAPAPTSTPAPTASPAPSPTPLPEYASIPGVYLGTFHGTSSPSFELFEELGSQVAISALYLSWNKGFNPGMYNANARIGRISFITWEYMQWQAGPMQGYEDLPLQAILDGRHDPYLLDWAEGVRDFDLPIFIRWGHEMNGDWYPWSGIFNGAGTLDGFGDPGKADGPERFVAAYQYIHDLFESAGAENVLWVWCPNAPFSVMESVYSPWNTASAYYPGDEYVDWLCFDGYNWGTSAFGQSFNSTWASFDEIFAESYRELQALNPDKPIIIGEFASTEDGGDKAAWITDAFESVKSDYPQIRALIWFHIAKETDWRINSSPEAFAAFQRAVSGPYWLETWLDFEGQ